MASQEYDGRLVASFLHYALLSMADTHARPVNYSTMAGTNATIHDCPAHNCPYSSQSDLHGFLKTQRFTGPRSGSKDQNVLTGPVGENPGFGSERYSSQSLNTRVLVCRQSTHYICYRKQSLYLLGRFGQLNFIRCYIAHDRELTDCPMYIKRYIRVSVVNITRASNTDRDRFGLNILLPNSVRNSNSRSIRVKEIARVTMLWNMFGLPVLLV